MTAAPVVLIASVIASVILRARPMRPRRRRSKNVLSRAASYVVRFDRVIPSIVAEEHYRQRLVIYRPQAPGRRAARPPEETQRTELKSDFLMVRSRDTDMLDPVPRCLRGGRQAGARP